MDDFAQQPFGYSTKRSDFASGLVYFGYRFYMPNLGRWLNRDPLHEQGGINLYAYVSGDPLGYVDPDGRWALIVSIYRGGGVGITLGYDPETGNKWVHANAGVGVAAIASFDSFDNGTGECGTNYGGFADWSVMTNGVGIKGETRSDG